LKPILHVDQVPPQVNWLPTMIYVCICMFMSQNYHSTKFGNEKSNSCLAHRDGFDPIEPNPILETS